jgi:hypothetical protein
MILVTGCTYWKRAGTEVEHSFGFDISQRPDGSLDLDGVWVDVKDRNSGMPVADCVVSTGVYNVAVDDVLGKTDSAGHFHGRFPNADFVKAAVFAAPDNSVWIECPGYIPARNSLFASDTNTNMMRTEYDHPAGWSFPFQKPSRKSIVMHISLERGTPTSGRVLTADDSPVANEPLLIVGVHENWPVQHQTTTDTDGRFHWDESPGGELYVALGLHDNDSASFQKLTFSDGEAVVHVGPKWHAATSEEAQSNLVYIARKDEKPVFPTSLTQLDIPLTAKLTESAAGHPLLPPGHLVLSIPANGLSCRFLSISEDGRKRSCGEMQATAAVKSPPLNPTATD